MNTVPKISTTLLEPTAKLRVGGPAIVDWPADNPAITAVRERDGMVCLWTNTKLSQNTAKATFMVLQEFDGECGGNIVGEVELPWFGSCRVFRIAD